jgi:hypothetical protein
MVKQLVFRKKASGNFIVNIANVLNTFVKENDEAKVQERFEKAKADRIVEIKAAVKEEEERLAAEKAAAEAAAELALKNSLLAQFAEMDRQDALERAQEAQKNIEAINSIPEDLLNLLQLRI